MHLLPRPTEAERDLDHLVHQPLRATDVDRGSLGLRAKEGADVEPLAERVVVEVDVRIALELEELHQRGARSAPERVVELA